MKQIITLILFVFAFSQVSNSQTLTKTASKNTVSIGEEFFYTISIQNINQLSDLVRIEDRLGPNLDFVRVELSPSMQVLINWGFCNYIQDVYDINTETLNLNFNNCNGVPFTTNAISFKVFVKFNKSACGLTAFNNQATLILKDNQKVLSNINTVNINTDNPYTLQKTFRNYNAVTKTLVYDVRLSSTTGDFKNLDFVGSLPFFKDEFSIPSCFSLSGNTNDVEVIQVLDEVNFTGTLINTNPVITSSDINLNWVLDPVLSSTPSILYQVKIKVDDCKCLSQPPQLFDINNTVYFEAEDICGNRISKTEKAIITNVSCKPNLTGSGGTPSIPVRIKDSIRVSKSLKLDGNDLNLTMAGCTGKYIINVTNSSNRLTYNTLKIIDLVPQELDITGVNIIGNASQSVSGNSLTIGNNGNILPNENVVVEIGFKVNTPLPNINIDNCAEVLVNGVDDNNSPFTLETKACAPTLRTVPNKVAVVARKSLCNQSEKACGPFTITDNLPGDIIEYSLHFYNYGTAKGNRLSLEDVLPVNFKINNLNNDVKVYAKKSGRVESDCDISSFKNITTKVSKTYDVANNKVNIDFKRMELDEFTCEGVVHFVVKLKVKIDETTPNGTYSNIYKLKYRDASTGSSNTILSNSIDTVVNTDNLIIGNKSVEEEEVDCINDTKKVTYKIILANMGSFPVMVDLNDRLTLPTGVSISHFGPFKECITNGVNSTICTPNNNITPSTLTSDGFEIKGLKLAPCEVRVISYEVVFDVSKISKGKLLEVCNSATVSTYVIGSKNKTALITSNPSLIETYLKAKTNKERYNVLQLIKAVKTNPEIVNNTSKTKNYTSKSSKNIVLSKELLGSACVYLKACIPEISKGCLSQETEDFDFEITRMNRNGEIFTALNNTSGSKVTKIEYILNDVSVVDTCEEGVYYFNGKPYYYYCLGKCSEQLVGRFYSTSPSPSVGNFLINQPPVLGPYGQLNKVEYSSLPTVVTQDLRTFKFPVSVNCNGTFKYTITAIVHFENCAACYVTDAYIYNASYRPVFAPISTGTIGAATFNMN